MAKRLEYAIGVDASKGIQGLKQFESAVKKSMGAVESAVDDSTTSGQKLAKVLSQMASTMESEMKQAAAAAEALEKALGPELAGRADMGQIVGDLNRMGLSFDEITADADHLAASLRQLDGVQMAGMQQGLSGVETSVGRIGKSADQSGSVLANMAGNAAQDMGTLAGVTGTAGVAIGQLAEYATEGNIALGAFAKVAGPMLALGAVAQIVGEAIGGIKAEEAFRADLVEQFTDALREGETVASTMLDTLSDTGELEFQALNEGMLGLGTSTKNLVPLLAKANLNLAEFQGIVDGVAAGTLDIQSRVSLGEFLESIGKGAALSEEDLIDLNVAIQQYADTSDEAIDGTKALNKVLKVSEDAAKDAFRAWQQAQDPIAQFPEEIFRIGQAMRRGLTPAAADLEAVSEGLGITITDVLGIAFDELTRRMETNSEATKDWTGVQREALEAADDFSVSLTGAEASLAEMASAFGEMARREGAIEAAFAIGDAPFKAEENAANLAVAIEELAAFVREHGPPISDGINDLTKIDFSHGEVDVAPFIAKLEAVKEPLRRQVADAFLTGGEEAARTTALGLIAAITDALGGAISPQDLDTLLFGEGGHTAVIKIAIEQDSLAKAKGMIEVLTGLGGETPFTAAIKLALDAGTITPEGAQVLVAQAIGDIGVPVPTELLPPDPTNAKAEADRWAANPANAVAMYSLLNRPSNLNKAWNDTQRALNLLPPLQFQAALKIPGSPFGMFQDAGGTTGPHGGIVAERRPEIAQFPGSGRRVLLTEPTVVPPGTRVTSGARTARILRHGGGQGLRRYDQGGIVGGPHTLNINVSAGVIGNRYDVMRTVERAGRDKIRLLGTRG